MKRSPVTLVALVVTVASLLSCVTDSEVTIPSGWPPLREIEGLWARQTDDGVWMVREFYEPAFGGGEFTAAEWFYADGEEPVLFARGAYDIENDSELPSGEIVDRLLIVYPGGSTLRQTFDVLESVDDRHLVLRGIYDDDPVTYDAVDELP